MEVGRQKADLKSRMISAFQLSCDSTSGTCKIPQNISQLSNIDLSQSYFKEIGSHAHSHVITTLNHAVNAFPVISEYKNQDIAGRSNYISLSNVSTAVVYSANTSNYNSDVNSAVKLEANDNQVQKFDIATLPKCISQTVVNVKQELPSVVSSNNNCSVSRDITKVSYPVRNAKPSFQSTNLHMLLKKKEFQSNYNILPVSRCATETFAAKTSVEIYEQDIPINDTNSQMCPGYSSQIASNKQKDLSQNVSPDTDSKQNLKNLLHSGGFSVESNQLYSWNNRNERLSQIRTESNLKSLFSQSIVTENELNSPLNSNNLNKCSLPQYPVHYSIKPILTSQQLEFASDANCLSNKNKTKFQHNSYQTSDSFRTVADNSFQCSRNSQQDVENPENLVYYSTLQPSKPVQFDNNSVFSPQNPSYIARIDSRETHLQNSSFFTGTLQYTGIKVQNQPQVNPNVSNLEVKNAGVPISDHPHSVFFSEQNPVNLTNEDNNLIFFQNPPNLMMGENYDCIKAYSNCSLDLNKCKQTTVTEPVQIFTQPADIYIPYDDSKSECSYSPSDNSTFPANIKVENSDLHPLTSDDASKVTNFKHSEPDVYNSSLKLPSDEFQSSYSEIFNAVTPIQQNCNYDNNNIAKQNMYNSYKAIKSKQPNFSDNSSHNEPYAEQHSMLNTSASVKNLEACYESYSNPQFQYSFKHLYKAHRAPNSSQQKQHIFPELNNPHKLEFVMRQRAFHQNQLKRPLLQNPGGLPNTVFHSNLSNQQPPTMQQSALNSASALQTSELLPGFQYFKPGNCNNYQNISSSHRQSISSDYQQNISSNHPTSR